MNILFMCPHAAGKSLAAATYFRDAATSAGIDVEITVAGPDPDPINMPGVTEILTRQGFAIDWNPRLVTEGDLRAADKIVSIGCDRTTIPAIGRLIEWDVPQLGDDLSGSLAAIRRHTDSLVASLAAEDADADRLGPATD